jgi:hypothetical protein
MKDIPRKTDKPIIAQRTNEIAIAKETHELLVYHKYYGYIEISNVDILQTHVVMYFSDLKALKSSYPMAAMYYDQTEDALRVFESEHKHTNLIKLFFLSGSVYLQTDKKFATLDDYDKFSYLVVRETYYIDITKLVPGAWTRLMLSRNKDFLEKPNPQKVTINQQRVVADEQYVYPRRSPDMFTLYGNQPVRAGSSTVWAICPEDKVPYLPDGAVTQLCNVVGGLPILLVLCEALHNYYLDNPIVYVPVLSSELLVASLQPNL